MGPIGVDYMHRAVTETNVQVLVDQSVADCSLDKKNMSKCLFAFDEALTPTVTQITSIRTGTGTYSVSIAGVRLSCLEEANTMDCGIQVLVGALYECSVSQSSDTNILCQIKTPFLEAGMHKVQVIVPGKGTARGLLSFTYELEIAAIEPDIVNFDIVNTVTIQGAGFSPVVKKNRITIGGNFCEPNAVSAYALVCTLGPGDIPGQSGARRLLSGSIPQLEVVFDIGGIMLTPVYSNITEVHASVPIVTSVQPSVGSVLGGFLVTISGSFFSSVASDMTVMMGPGATPCVVFDASNTTIRCMAETGAVGTGPVTVYVANAGVSVASTSPVFEYQFSVHSISRTVIGFGGGTFTFLCEALLHGCSPSLHGCIGFRMHMSISCHPRNAHLHFSGYIFEHIHSHMYFLLYFLYMYACENVVQALNFC